MFIFFCFNNKYHLYCFCKLFFNQLSFYNLYTSIKATLRFKYFIVFKFIVIEKDYLNYYYFLINLQKYDYFIIKGFGKHFFAKLTSFINQQILLDFFKLF